LLENGQVVKTYNISSGKAITPTPVGQFQIYEKQKLRISSQAVPYRMPNYMAFTPNEAFGLHGLPYLGSIKEESAYWREARSHIGIPVSHGCIRFLPEEAAEIYDWAEVGTKVNIQA
jgi:lipoprotein-anchoring transpeptidase ErfK/SrfK